MKMIKLILMEEIFGKLFLNELSLNFKWIKKSLNLWEVSNFLMDWRRIEKFLAFLIIKKRKIVIEILSLRGDLGSKSRFFIKQEKYQNSLYVSYGLEPYPNIFLIDIFRAFRNHPNVTPSINWHLKFSSINWSWRLDTSTKFPKFN